MFPDILLTPDKFMVWKIYMTLPEKSLASEPNSGVRKFYGVGSVIMLPYQIRKSGSVWRVWRQTRQTDGLFLMKVTEELWDEVLAECADNNMDMMPVIQQVMRSLRSVTCQ